MFKVNLFIVLAIVSGTCFGRPQEDQGIETTTTPTRDADTLISDNTNTLLSGGAGAISGLSGYSGIDNTLFMAPMEHDHTFVQIGQKEYLIDIDQEVNFFRAAHICRTYDAHLVSIETSAEMQALSNHLLLNGFTFKSFWTSGNDLANKDSFFWLGTGYAIGYAKWGLDEPNNKGGNERCVNIWTYKSNKNSNVFHLNDLDCQKNAHFICEKN